MFTLLTIENGVLVAKTGDVLAPGGKVIRALHDLAEFGDDVFCSSSVDFPQDYTGDPDVIALCRDIRGC
jgi:hypothetical protein